MNHESIYHIGECILDTLEVIHGAGYVLNNLHPDKIQAESLEKL